MTIGCLGDITFEVSADVVKTISGATWSGSARYTSHKNHLKNSTTEFTGIEPDEFQFTMKLSAFLGVSNPMADIGTLWTYERQGKAVPLVIGTKCYGKFKWCVVSHKVSMQQFDGAGNLLSADVSVKLMEYIGA